MRHSADKPLVVEWPAAERAALEARANAGLVAVRYEGCEMEILSGCDVDGAYAFAPLSRKQERVTIHNADELYARLPVGAASLEGKLERRGELVVDMTIVGRKQADRHVFERGELRGRCESATHVLTGLTVGAFSLLAGASTEARAGADVGKAGAGGRVLRSQELLAADGDPSACPLTPIDDEPAAGCGALLRVEAVPLAGDVAEALRPMFSKPAVTTQLATGDTTREARLAHRRAAAWRGTAIGAGVLSAASVGGIIGGMVLLVQYQDDTFGLDYEPTAADARKRRTGTGLVIGSSAGFLGFGALALGAGQASRRSRALRSARLAPSLSPSFSGLTVAGRF